MKLIGGILTALFISIGAIGLLILVNNWFSIIDDPVLQQKTTPLAIVYIAMGTISFLIWRQFQRGLGEPSSDDSIWTRIARAMQENW